MKGCMIALAILTLIVAAVIANAAYVRFVTDSLAADLAALPDNLLVSEPLDNKPFDNKPFDNEPLDNEPFDNETAAAVAAVRENFEKHLPLLSVTVAYPVLDRVTESLRILETHAQTGDNSEYAATLTLLRELVEEIARLEKLSVENIL